MTDNTMVDAGTQLHDADVLRTKAATAKAAVADLAGEMRHFASDRLGRFKTRTGEKLRQANDSVVDFVQHNPYKSLAIAAGLGLAVGMLIKRR
jgi:ElaB/YqjD/DUF883 family membrane-anchored ribosome-binding protein